MKIIIDIPDEMYINAMNCNLCGSLLMVSAIRNGIAIPNNATSGDIIEAMFPNARITECKDYIQVISRDYSQRFEFNKSWWNSPYRKEQE